MGKRSAEVLSDVWAKGLGGPDGVVLPPDTHLFETRLVVYNKIPLELVNKLYPIELDQNLLGSLRIVGLVCYGVIVLTAIICLIWTVYNRRAVVVRAAHPFFLFVLLGGIVVMASTIIPLSFDDQGNPDEMTDTFAVGVCMSQPWLAFIGFSIVFSALFSKNWRINKLFHSQRSHARVRVTTIEVLTPFACIFTCNVIILICWTVIDPLTYVRLIGDGTDFWNREIESYGACRSEKALAFLTPLALINFMVLGIACWQAFEARNIESEFSESKYIGLSVASLFQGFIIVIPILVVVKDEPRPFYLVLALTIFVMSEAILLLIFLPKMILAYEYSTMSEAEQKQSLSDRIQRSSIGSIGRPSCNSHGEAAASTPQSSHGKKKVPITASKFFRDRAESAIAKMPTSSSGQQEQQHDQTSSSHPGDGGRYTGSDNSTQRASEEIHSLKTANGCEQKIDSDVAIKNEQEEMPEEEEVTKPEKGIGVLN